MKKRRPDPLLIFITLIVISGFQVYWIRDSYFREKKSLEARTNVLFRETVRQVKDSILKTKLFVALRVSGREPHAEKIEFTGHPENIRTIKVATLLGEKTDMFVNVRRHKDGHTADSDEPIQFPNLAPEDVKEINVVDSAHHTRQMNTLYYNDAQGKQIIIRIDSLFRDSVTVRQLSAAFQKALKAEQLVVPFSILRQQADSLSWLDDMNSPALSSASFSGYSLELGKVFPYLFRKITFPILFSLFLVGVTVISFILLYRTLLKQERLAVMKNDFISNITHELKTPIATVGVAIEALKNFGATESPVRTMEYLDISVAELQRLSLLVDKVLTLSMFENQEVTLKKEQVDLGEVVTEVLKIMKLQFDKQHAVLQVKTEGNNFMMEADRLHLVSVLYNLLDNALKYSPDKPQIQVVLKELPRDILELSISDHGIGIPKEYQGKIFDKFFRVPKGNQHNTKGYGLGLSYVTAIVHQHMGYITVSSGPETGTTFTIKVPRKEADVIYFDEKRRIYKKSIKIAPADATDKLS